MKTKKSTPLIERIAEWLKSKDRYRLIPRTNPQTGEVEKYLERFYILSTKFVGVYLHRFWADDPDEIHDHPWHFISFILKGGYIEEVPERQSVPHGPKLTLIRKPLWPIFHTKKEAHRIIIPLGENGNCWSLFIRFGFKRRIWGFYNHNGWTAAKYQSRKELPD